MEDNKNFTIEELKVLYENATKESETLGEMLRQKEQEEEDRKKAQLALEKESRKKEVDDAFEKYHDLLKAYIEDYGSFTTVCNANDDFFLISPFWHSFF